MDHNIPYLKENCAMHHLKQYIICQYTTAPHNENIMTHKKTYAFECD